MSAPLSPQEPHTPWWEDAGRERPPRHFANVRRASVAARWILFVLLTLLALFAFVGVALVWGD